MNPSRHKSLRKSVAPLALYLLAAYSGVVALGLVLALRFIVSGGGTNPQRYDPIYRLMVIHGGAMLLLLFAGAALRRRPGRSSPRLDRTVLVLGVVLTIVSTDRLMGVIFPPPLPSRSIFEMHPRRGWAHIPFAVESGRDTHAGNVSVQLDGNGLRVEYGAPIREIDSDNRILFLGDSVTFGYYRKSSETFAMLTADFLNKAHPGKNIVSLNAGVTGYDTSQEYDLLVHDGFRLRPRLVVLGICLNDVTKQFDPASGPDQRRHPEFAQARPPTHWSGWVRAAMRLVRRIQYGASERDAAARIEHFYFSELLAEPATPRVAESWNRVKEELKKIVTACRERDVPLVVLGFPIRRQLALEGAGDAPQQRLTQICRELDVAFIDLLPVFKGTEPASEKLAERFFPDQTHPTLIGHRLAAESLVEFLEREKLIERIFK